MARDGSLEWVVLGFGSGRGKVRTETLLAGEGADAKVTGAYAPHGRQHIDFDTTQEHGAPNTTSDLAFRGILADRSSAVWRGMIKVDPGAQQTDAFQECRNLLLSKRAHADAIPGLEILANDVRCTHAAAIAQIDREQLFYLRSRGLDEAIATRLVIEGFMAELVERFAGFVDPGAQQTDAFQECRNLLLSKRAHADAIPGLEILANDVRCTHAAAIAQIDREQLFYLRTRGLDEADAMRLVIEGFMAELVERFEEGPVREALATAIERRLAALLGLTPPARRAPRGAAPPGGYRRLSHSSGKGG